MISLILAALAVAAECPAGPGVQPTLCRALAAQQAGSFAASAGEFEAAAAQVKPGDPAADRMLAAAGNMWIAAGEPGKAALALDRALAGSGLLADQRGAALLDRARAAEAQGDLKTARAKLTEAAQSASEDPFLWYFSAALAIREGDLATAQSAVGKALALAPNDPAVLFEAGHVANAAGEADKARGYWQRAIATDPDGASGKAAREALALLDKPAAR
jgi:tetratricopeptide (TPR) repeat protein